MKPDDIILLAAAYQLAAAHIDMQHMQVLRPAAKRLLKKADRIIRQLPEFQRWQVEELRSGREPTIHRFVWSGMKEVFANA